MLMTSRYLATDLNLDDNITPKVEATMPARLKAGATSIEVTVTASDDLALRAASFFVHQQDSVVGGRELKGREQRFTQTLSVSPLKKGKVTIDVLIADHGGNTTVKAVTADVD